MYVYITYLLLFSVKIVGGNILLGKSRCPLYIVTLATNEYSMQSAFLRSQIAKFSGQKCDLEIVTTNCTFQELTKFKTNEVRQHKNSFAGIDVKIGAILSFLERIPQNSVFLWLDSSLVVNNFNFLQIKLSIKRREILFAREGSSKKIGANIGVILMKNTPRVTQLLIQH